MENLNLFAILLIIFGILQIILFFKLWIMTNDVRKLVCYFCPDDNVERMAKNKTTVIATNEEVDIIGYYAGKYKCYNPKSMAIEYFSKNDLAFNEIGDGTRNFMSKSDAFDISSMK